MARPSAEDDAVLEVRDDTFGRSESRTVYLEGVIQYLLAVIPIETEVLTISRHSRATGILFN